MRQEFLGPLFVFGVLVGAQAGGTPTLASIVQFASLLLLGSFPLKHLFFRDTSSATSSHHRRLLPRRLSLSLVLRSVLLFAVTAGWAFAAASLGVRVLLMIELVVGAGVHLPKSYWSHISSTNRPRILLLVPLLVLLLVFTAYHHTRSSSPSSYLVLIGTISCVVAREVLRLGKETHTLLGGGLLSLVSLVVGMALWGFVIDAHMSIWRVVVCGWLMLVLPSSSSSVSSSSSILTPSTSTQSTSSTTTFYLSLVPFSLWVQLGLWLSFPLAAHVLSLAVYLAVMNNGGQQSSTNDNPSSSTMTSILSSWMALLATGGIPNTKATSYNHTTRPYWLLLPPSWKELSKDSQRLVLFLGLTFGFMLVELGMGLFTNSLGLLGDAGHMFFDSSALLLGLVASIMATRVPPPDSGFTYGYGRIELVAGFVNALFLTFVSAMVMAESVERFHAPPRIRTQGLVLTAVLGLAVNGIGIVFFHHHHSGSSHHGHSHASDDTEAGGGHQHSHSHIHVECTHDDDHHHVEQQQGHKENMEGVYLHIVADALGSLGVIFSSLLVQTKGWDIADPICSIFVSVLILASALPLLRSTATALLLRVPSGLETTFASFVDRLVRRKRGTRVIAAHLWRHSAETLVATLRVAVMGAQGDEEDTRSWAMHVLRTELGVNDVTIEVVVVDSHQQGETTGAMAST